MTDLDRELSKLKPAVELRGAPHEQPIKGVRAFLKVGELQADEPAPEQSRFAMAYEILSPLSAGCKRENFACQISFDPETLVTQVDAQVDVNRAPLDFTVLADPSAWTEESPLFWQRSDLGDFTGGTFVSDSPQPAPGFGPYNNRGLFEAINLSWNPFFPLTGNNVLRATHGQLGHGILPLKGQCTASMHVSLDLSLDTTIGFSQARGGLDVDSGAVEIRSLDEPGTQTRLRASKRARFTERVVCGVRLGPWINMFAPFFLGPWIATLVYEGACTNSAKDGEDT
jgi:hypothetical protein